ncbi:MAG: DUF4440 domain-containing protein [Gammaproteobacteria bacterium]|nr:MAG: DUF4440 domain-containing protein [Gammaproteobacteria bacterium]
MQGMDRVKLALLILSAVTTPAIATSADTDHPAAAVVLTFNRAISARDMETALAQLADGSVQFQLHPAHPGMPADPPLTDDLRKTWQVVAAILFPSTESYLRDVSITAVRADGELATVWAQTRTVTQRKGQQAPMELEFSELYLLANRNGEGWRIIANASNRPVDDVAVASGD